MQATNAADSEQGEHAILERLNLNYIRSVQESDAKWFEQNLDQDFVNTNPDGTLSERPDFIAFIARPCAVTKLKCEDVHIRLHGDAAVIHARTAYVKPDGQAAVGRYTDVWMRRGTEWKCVSAQVTRG
jgi:ketosteroid isomerase-like protein